MFVSVFSLSFSCQLMIPAVARATRVSLSSVVMAGQSTWSVLSLLRDTGTKLTEHRAFLISDTAVRESFGNDN